MLGIQQAAGAAARNNATIARNNATTTANQAARTSSNNEGNAIKSVSDFISKFFSFCTSSNSGSPRAS